MVCPFVSNISHFKLFLCSEENKFSGESFNAVSECTWPQPHSYHSCPILKNCLCDTSLTSCCFICKRFSICSPNKVWCLVVCLCVCMDGCLYSQNVQRTWKYQDEQLQMCRHMQSTRSTNVKRGVGKLITNTRLRFVENMVNRNRIRMDNAV